ncbi:MAG TPA: putative zinc-binding protein [Phycisphaerae bacterium]|nr:putative zinc-binding protein [Phycisphaerae bacterium]HUU23876.1 putative zinc-binding protein [Phycisphaerae bacterium]
MSDCCNRKDETCCGEGRTVLLYACSGGANVAEAADRAARALMADGCGTMFCLAGLGAGIDGMIQTARDADLNVVIDGCGMDCARKVFDGRGLTNYVQVKVTDLGIEKVKGVRATDEQVEVVAVRVKEAMAES